MKTADVTTAKTKAGHTLIFGVLFLTASNLIVKVIGMLFKVPISYVLKDEGMGYFNIAYTIYIWLYILSTAGVPVGVSILVSKAKAQGKSAYVKKIIKSSMLVFGAIGFLGSLLLFLFPTDFANFIGSANATYCVVAIAPALFLVAVASVLRGYFQGCGLMAPTAISQLLEALGKLIGGILLANYAASQGLGLAMVAAHAIFGVSIGSFLSFIFLTIASKAHQSKTILPQTEQATNESVIKPLLSIILPITLSSCVMSITSLIDLTMIMRRLQSIGYTEAQSAALYGNYTTLAIPIFNLPSILIYPIACAIVPSLTKAHVKNDVLNRNKMEALSIKATSILAFPCAFGIGIFAYPILSSIFEDNSAKIAAPYLAVLSPAIISMCLLATTNAILQARGMQIKPIFSMLTSAALKLVVDFFLIGREDVGMFGAAIGTVIFYFVAAVMNFYFIFKENKKCFKISEFIVKPFLISFVSVFSSYIFYKNFAPFLSKIPLLTIAILIAIVIFGILLLFTGTISSEEINYIPLKAKHINTLKAFLYKHKSKKA